MKRAGLKRLGRRLRDTYAYAHLIGTDDLRPSGVIPSGVATLDVAIGCGGFPMGRYAILHGPEASGKTTLALEVVAECQRLDGVAVYLDFERKLDLAYVARIGVDPERLILAHPPTIEKGFELLSMLVEHARQIDGTCPVLIVWDSLHAALARRTVDGEWDKESYPSEAHSYSRGFGKFVGQLHESQAVMLAISQVRMKLDGFRPAQKIGVGHAPLFYASLILEFRASVARGTVKAGPTGQDVTVKVAKNQVATPHKKATFSLIYGSGVDRPGALLLAAEAAGLAAATKCGWYTVSSGDGEALRVQGAAGMAKVAEQDPKAYAALRAAVYETIGRAIDPTPESGDETEEDSA